MTVMTTITIIIVLATPSEKHNQLKGMKHRVDCNIDAATTATTTR